MNENTATSLLEIAGRFCLVMLYLLEDGFKPAVNFHLDPQSEVLKQLVFDYENFK